MVMANPTPGVFKFSNASMRTKGASLAAALAHLGRISEARATAKAGLALEPSFTIGRFSAGARSDNPVYLAGRERIYEGMRRAGIPE